MLSRLMSSQRPSFAKRDREMKLKDKAKEKAARRAARQADRDANPNAPVAGTPTEEEVAAAIAAALNGPTED